LLHLQAVLKPVFFRTWSLADAWIWFCDFCVGRTDVNVYHLAEFGLSRASFAAVIYTISWSIGALSTHRGQFRSKL
jgi:hypothetical protein